MEEVVPLQADEGYADGDDDSSSTASLRSSLLEGLRENGRRYHRYKEGKYLLPDDDWEADRLDMQHELWLRSLDNRLYTAPLDISRVHNVLDLGTGTGIWAIDFADDHPLAKVIGVDLSPIQPSYVPPNCIFQVDDVEEPWTFKEKFDYIHGRVLLGGVRDWQNLFRQAYDALQPGGWLEMQDITYPVKSDDGTLKDDSAIIRWSHLMIEGASKTGRELTRASDFKQWMSDTGFVNVTQETMRWPMNKWPKDKKMKEVGNWTNVTITEGLQGFSIALMTRHLGMQPEEVELLLMDVRKEMMNRNIHSYWPVYIVCGQKPDLGVG